MRLTIGIPVYNGEKTIDKCMESVVKCRGFKNYEILCVNDGSTDGTAQKLALWEKKYRNIRAITSNENKGAFLSRQRIIDEASGEWIGFVDVDDRVNTDMYRCMLGRTEKDDVDIVVSAFQKDGTVHMDTFGNGHMEITPARLGYLLAVNPAYWNKIYRVSLIKKALRLNYSPKIMEDGLFFCSIVPYIKGISFIKRPLYEYGDTTSSVTTKIGFEEVKQAEEGIKCLLSVL